MSQVPNPFVEALDPCFLRSMDISAPEVTAAGHAALEMCTGVPTATDQEISRITQGLVYEPFLARDGIGFGVGVGIVLVEAVGAEEALQDHLYRTSASFVTRPSNSTSRVNDLVLFVSRSSMRHELNLDGALGLEELIEQAITIPEEMSANDARVVKLAAYEGFMAVRLAFSAWYNPDVFYNGEPDVMHAGGIVVAGARLTHEAEEHLKRQA